MVMMTLHARQQKRLMQRTDLWIAAIPTSMRWNLIVVFISNAFFLMAE